MKCPAPNASVLYFRARRFYLRPNPKKAIALLDKIPATAPEAMNAWMLKCRIIYESRSQGGLRAHLRAVIENDPRLLDPVFKTAYCFYQAKASQGDMHLLTARDWMLKSVAAGRETGRPELIVEPLLSLSDVYRQIGPAFTKDSEQALEQGQAVAGKVLNPRRQKKLLAMYHGFKGRHYLSCNNHAAARTRVRISEPSTGSMAPVLTAS